MNDIELKIKSALLNKKITDIEFYNINDSYLVFDENAQWVFDGGIQIKHESGLFSFGWDSENQGFDYAIDKSIDSLIADLPFYSVDAKKIAGISSLIGSEVETIDFEWDYYQEFDENAELKEEKIYVPVQMNLTFKFNNFLQIALIDFTIKENPFEIVNPVFNLAGQLYISLNKNIYIRKEA